MMKNLILGVALSTALLSCDVATGIYSGLRGQPNASASAEAAPQITRAQINESGVAMIRTSLNRTGWDYLIALSSQYETTSFGQKGRIAISMRGGLVVSAYTVGNDLLNVTPNAQDPIQQQRAYASWPSNYTRTYELPGEGLLGDLRKVQCQHTPLGEGSIEIIEQFHQTQLIEETCQGNDLKFSNRYMIDASGFIWKSEQWVGQNPIQLLVEIIEPLD